MVMCTLSFCLRRASAIWSSEPGFKGICHRDGHFNWTINFWKDSSRYLDELVFLPLSKTPLSPSHTPSDNIFIRTISTYNCQRLFLPSTLHAGPGLSPCSSIKEMWKDCCEDYCEKVDNAMRVPSHSTCSEATVCSLKGLCETPGCQMTIMSFDRHVGQFAPLNNKWCS